MVLQIDHTCWPGHLPSKQSIVFIGHGSRNPNSNKYFKNLLSAYGNLHPDTEISYGYIEQAKPNIDEALEKAAQKKSGKNNLPIIVAPILLFRGSHANKDIPEALAKVSRRYPQNHFHVSEVLGVDLKLAKLAYQRIKQTGLFKQENQVITQTAIIYLGRGSQNQQVRQDFQKQLLLLQKQSYPSFGWVLPAFCSMQQPSLKETLAKIPLLGAKQVIVVPHLLFPGILTQKAQNDIQAYSIQYPKPSIHLAAPLGIDSLLLELIHERVSRCHEAVSKTL